MKRTTKKGFTLIELLAVIVILAIIALIAVPVILNIIDKANIVAFKDTAYGVLSAAEYYYAASQLELEGPKGTVEMETTDSRLEIKGNVPNGKVMITREGEIALAVYNDRYCVTKGYNDEDITITEDFETCEIPSGGSGNEGTGGNTGSILSDIITTTSTCVTSGTCTAAEIKAGILVNVKVNKNDNYDFYVIKDDGTTVTLIMSENLGNNVAWYVDADNNSYGPTTALAEIALRTKDWENIPEKTYTLSGLAEDGSTRRYENKTVTGRARLLTYEEAKSEEIGCQYNSSGSCPAWMYANLYNTGDNSTFAYWTSTASAASSRAACYVYYIGSVNAGNTSASTYGIRPVIELSK